MNRIPFNRPVKFGNERKYIDIVLEDDKFSGNGKFTKKCNKLLEQKTGTKKAIMTSSCTDALEMASLLADIEPKDEVIIPSYTFVTTASAFERRKAKIVWAEIRRDTKNIDENKIEKLITEKTKAIVIVHYAGVSCNMDKIREICKKYNLILIEDAAQAINSTYKGKPLGSFGDLSAISFHETKNIQCGEGGVLLVNNPDMIVRAQFIRDKGTNRIHFNEGKVDKYTWVELGSSFLMSELQAAFLYPQLKNSKKIINDRLSSWNKYYKILSKFIPEEKMPIIPDNCSHNGHMFYLMCSSYNERKRLINFLEAKCILAVFHYVPLHKAPYWKGKYNNIKLPVTEEVSNKLVRLPMYSGMSDEEILYITDAIKKFYRGNNEKN